MRLPVLMVVVALVQSMSAPAPVLGDGSQPYRSINGPCTLEFPKDHGPHPGYRTEWWYYTGNVESATGKPYGFQLTFFRSQVSPPGAEESWPEPPSAWRTQQIYLAHTALSDISEGLFHHTERIARGALGLAGAEVSSGSTTVFLKDWRVNIGESHHRLRAKTETFDLDLEAAPVKPLILQGRQGYSLKGPRPEQSSCYTSFTRLQVRGHIRIGGETVPVSGLAWMDHEFSSEPLHGDLVGWDWFSLQFNNRSELMIYLLRNRGGGYSPQSAGTFVTAEGESIHLSGEELQSEVLEEWKSPRSGAVYPSKWRIRVPSLGIDVRLAPRLKDQELHTPGSTRITYWEGSVSAEGTMMENRITGTGYMELTGYAQPMDTRL